MGTRRAASLRMGMFLLIGTIAVTAGGPAWCLTIPGQYCIDLTSVQTCFTFTITLHGPAAGEYWANGSTHEVRVSLRASWGGVGGWIIEQFVGLVSRDFTDAEVWLCPCDSGTPVAKVDWQSSDHWTVPNDLPAGNYRMVFSFGDVGYPIIILAPGNSLVPEGIVVPGDFYSESGPCFHIGPPRLTLNGATPETAECGETYTDAGATASDGFTPAFVVTTEGAVNTSVPGSYTLAYSAGGGNGSSPTPITRVVTVTDTQKPVITLNGSAEVTAECGTPYTDAGATAYDQCEGSVLVTMGGSVNTAEVGSYTLRYDTADGSGNIATQVTRVVTVTDTEKPVITLNGSTTVYVANGSAYADTGATAWDACAGNLAVTTTGTVNTQLSGLYMLHYSANDGHGNSAHSEPRWVNVVKPRYVGIECSANRVVATCSSPIQFTLWLSERPMDDPELTWSGTCAFTSAEVHPRSIDGLTYEVTVLGVLSPGTLCLNIPECSFIGQETGLCSTRTSSLPLGGGRTEESCCITVVDMQTPVIALNGEAGVTVECGSTYTDMGATATVACSESVAVTTTGSVDTAVPGAYTLTYSADDGHGNSALPVTRRVTVLDAEAPVIALNGSAEVTVECGATHTDMGATATDACSGSVAVTTTGSVDTAVPGAYTLTYDATDGPGFRALPVTRVVSVLDTQAPVIALNGSAEVMVECGATYTDMGATATDACSESVAVTKTGSVGTAVPGAYTLTYTADDGNWNSAAPVTRVVMVSDTLEPVITLTGDAAVTVECGASYLDAGASASDACSGALAVTTGGVVDTSVPGSYTLTYAASDGNGNSAAPITRVVNVTDTAVPVATLNGPSDMKVECGTNYAEAGATAMDACAGTLAVTTDGTVDTTAPGAYTLTYDASDGNGSNAVQVTRTVTVVDSTPPVITLLGVNPATVERHATYTDAGATATDSCAGDRTANIVAFNPVNTEVPGTYTVTYDVTDGNGNSAVQVPRVVKVVDTTPEAFAVSYAVVPPEGGTVTGPATITAGGTATVTVTANPGYVITSVGAGNGVVTSAPYTLLGVATDTTVTAVFAPQQAMVTVSDVSGMPADQAQAIFAGAGLTVSVAEERSDSVPAGQVIRQEPASGVQVAAGTQVRLVVSSGPANAGCACSGGANPFDFFKGQKALGDLFVGGLGVLALTPSRRRI